MLLADKFLLGSFAWKIVAQDKDTVIVSQVSPDGARMPFWKGELKGRALKTGLAFGRIMRSLSEAAQSGTLEEKMKSMGLNNDAADSASAFLKRQIEATGILPDDRTVLVEHFKDQNGSHQVMIHSLYGRQINAPLAILLQYTAQKKYKTNVGCVDEEEGILLYPYGDDILPEGLLFEINGKTARQVLEAILPQTPLFSMNFRYNAGRALMMGMKLGKRQPLWLQRLRSTQMMDNLLSCPSHPLIRETRRECLEENWDLPGMEYILDKIQSGQIAVREVHTDIPSPLSLPFQWKIEAAEMYEYTPVTSRMRETAYEELKALEDSPQLREPAIKPSAEELERLNGPGKLPQDEMQLHSFLMIEGDMAAGEMDIPADWLRSLSARGLAVYMEPGLWIATEQRKKYEEAQEEGQEQLAHIVRRMLYYRGARTKAEILERYFLREAVLHQVLEELCQMGSLVEDNGIYYHARLYDKARKATVNTLRRRAVTQPQCSYAKLKAGQTAVNAIPEEQLTLTLEQYCGKYIPAANWEEIIFPGRIRRYGEHLLDRLLAQGGYFWKLTEDGSLCFYRYSDIDWDAPLPASCEQLSDEEQAVFQELKRKGASFVQSLSFVPTKGSVQDVLLSLAQKGLVCADSFIPVRQWLNRDKMKKATVRQRVNVRVMALTAGRWDIVRPVKPRGLEEILEQLLKDTLVLCRETFREAAPWLAAFSCEEDTDVCWLNAADPAQVWGKAVGHAEGRSFMNVSGTAVALADGKTAAVMERQGRIFKVFEQKYLEQALAAFTRAFLDRKIFPSVKRLMIKEYPKDAGDAFEKAGFMKEMQDFVLYK